MKNYLRLGVLLGIVVGACIPAVSLAAPLEIQLNSNGTVPSPYVQTTWAFGAYPPGAAPTDTMAYFVYYGYNTWNTDRINQGLPAALNTYCSNNVSGTWSAYGYSPTNIGSSTASYAYSQTNADFHFSYLCSGTTFISMGSATNIAYVQPVDSQTPIATSTSFTFEVAGFVSAADWTPDTTVVLNASSNAYNQESSVYTSVNSQYSFSWLVPAAGEFILSTTTSVQDVGEYQMSAVIQQPTYSLFGLSLPFFTTGLAATSTQFVVGTTTQIDVAFNTMQTAYKALAATAASTTLASCGILEFNLTTCISALVVPNSSGAGVVFDSLKNGLLSVAPFGYVSRVVSIMTGTATSSLPSLVITLPAGYPGAGASLDLTPWNEMLGGDSILATATSSLSDGKTLRQITEPYWDIFILVLFALAVGHDLLGFVHTQSGRSKMSV